MSDNLPQYFDIKSMLNTPWTRSVNLMCHLLRGISYQRLYGDAVVKVAGKHVFDDLLANANTLPLALQCDADGKLYDVRKALADALAEVVRLIDDYNAHGYAESFILGDLFSVPRTDPPVTPLETVRNLIVDRLDQVYAEATRQGFNMRHFCAPFVDIQMGRAELVTAEGAMTNFLSVLGSKELIAFFTTVGTLDEKRAVKAATVAGILRAKPRIGAPTLLVHDGNGRCCTAGHCYADPAHPDYWCVEVVIGSNTYCALGSDSC